MAIDVDLQIGLGRFFAAKFRSGVLYAIHEQSGDRDALRQALQAYRQARAAWARMEKSASAYAADLSCSDRFDERGQWNDRLAPIDEDIAQMERRLPAAKVVDDAPRAGGGGRGAGPAAARGCALPASAAGAIPAEASAGGRDCGPRQAGVGADVLSPRQPGGAF